MMAAADTFNRHIELSIELKVAQSNWPAQSLRKSLKQSVEAVLYDAYLKTQINVGMQAKSNQPSNGESRKHVLRLKCCDLVTKRENAAFAEDVMPKCFGHPSPQQRHKSMHVAALEPRETIDLPEAIGKK